MTDKRLALLGVVLTVGLGACKAGSGGGVDPARGSGATCAGGQYTVQDLGALPGGDLMYSDGIFADGTVVARGNVTPGGQCLALVRRRPGGVLERVPGVAEGDCIADAVTSPAGTIAYFRTRGAATTFWRYSDERGHEPIPGPVNTERLPLLSMNQAGQIAAYRYSLGSTTETEALVYTPEVGFQSLPAPAGAGAAAIGMNDDGSVTGIVYPPPTPSGTDRRAARWVRTQAGAWVFEDLNQRVDPALGATLRRGGTSRGSLVIGEADVAGGLRGYILDLRTNQVRLFGPTVPNPFGFFAGDLSADGTRVVGAFGNPGESRAFVHDDATGFRPLQEIAPAISGWTTTSVTGMNAAGQILVNGTRGGRPAVALFTPIAGCQTGAITPAVTCVVRAADGPGFTAVFGYSNSARRNQYLAAAATVNAVEPGPADQGQPGWFKADGDPAGVVVRSAAGAAVTWRVNNQVATATASSPPCTTSITDEGLAVVIGDKTRVIARDEALIASASVDRTAQAVAGSTTAAGSIAGSFDVTSDGAATYAIPIKVPAGRNGVEPRLSLSYHSRRGPSSLGVGWSVSGLSEIARCNKNLRVDVEVAPVRFDGADALCLDGERLVEVRGNHPEYTHANGREYRTERNGGSRIIAHLGTSGDPLWFEVRLRSGRTLKYGSFPGYNRPNAAILGRVSRFSVVQTGDDPTTKRRQWTSYTMSWPLTEERDPFGNYLQVAYHVDSPGLGDPSPSVPHSYDDRPAFITYTGRGSQDGLRRVDFHYQPRTDPRDRQERYVAGVKLVNAHRLVRIDLSAPNPRHMQVVRYYAFDHQPSAATGRTLLAGVSECDPGAEATPGDDVCLPATRFNYDRGDKEAFCPTTGLSCDVVGQLCAGGPPGEVCTARYAGAFREVRSGISGVIRMPGQPVTAGPSQFEDAHLEIGDANGDGRDDLFYPRSGVYRFHLSNAPNEAAPVQSFGLAGAGVVARGSSALPYFLHPYAADIDGDGRAELVQTKPSGSNFLPDSTLIVYRFDGLRYVPWTGLFPDGELKESPGGHEARFVDFNGDGLLDLGFPTCNAGGCWWSVRPGVAGGFGPAVDQTGLTGHLESFGLTPISTGDGRRALVQANFQTYALPGTASVAPETLVVARPGDLPGGPPHQSHYIDVNGDGLEDFFESAATPVYYVNTGNGFDGPYQPATALGRSSLYRQGDFNGDGRPDLLTPWSSGPEGMEILQNNGEGFEVVGSGIPRGMAATASVGSTPVFDCMEGGQLVRRTDIIQCPRTRASTYCAEVWENGDSTIVNCQCAAGTNDNCVTRPTNPLTMEYATTRLLDWNGDGLTDVATVVDRGATSELVLWIRNGKKADVLRGVTTGLGATTELDHAPVTDGSVYARNDDPDACAYPLQCLKRGIWVVSKVRSDRGLAHRSTDEVSYFYRDGRTDQRGRGFLGFAEQRATRTVATGPGTGGTGFTQTTVTSFERAFVAQGDVFPFSRYPTRIETRVLGAGGLNRGTLQINTPDPDLRRRVPGVGGTVNARVYRVHTLVTETTEFENRLADPLAGEVKRTTRTERPQDDYGNVTSEAVSTTWRPEPGAPLQSSTTTTTTDFDPAPSDQFVRSRFLGLPTLRSTSGTYGAQSSEAPRQTRFQFDVDRAVVTSQTVQPGGGDDIELTTTFVRNADGLPLETSTLDRASRVRTTRIRYDNLEGMYPVRITNPAGHATEAVYHPGYDAAVMQIDPNGIASRNLIDGFGRARGTRGPASVATSIAYGRDATFPLIVATSSVGGLQRQEAAFDRLGREVRTRTTGFDGNMVVTAERTYDELGRQAAVRGPYGETSFGYDDFGRTTTVTRDDEAGDEDPATGRRRATLRHDHRGYYKTVTTNETDHESTAITDPSGQIREKHEPHDGRVLVTRYEYKPFGLLWKVGKGPDGATDVTEMAYDVLGRKTSIRTPDTGNTTTHYNAFGETRRQQDAEGRVTVFHVDELGRAHSRIDSHGAENLTTSFEHDSAAHGIGKLGVTTTADGIHTEFTYEGRFGLPSGSRLTIPGQNGGAPFATEVTFDDLARPSRLTYPATAGPLPRFAVTHRYSGASGVLERVTDSAETTTYWQADSRDPLGRISAERFDSGAIVSTRIYHPGSGRLESIVTSQGFSRLQDLNHDYFPDGNLRFRRDYQNGLHEGFRYDDLDRLDRWYAIDGDANDVSASSWSVAYGYDDLGNLTSRAATSPAGAQTITQRYDRTSNAGPHAITTSSLWPDPTAAFQYDLAGNVKRHPQAGTIDYTPFNLPKKVSGGAADPVWYRYDASGTRVMKTPLSSTGNWSGALATIYIGDLYERRFTSTEVNDIFKIRSADRIIAQVRRHSAGTAEETTYLFADRLGSTDATQTGESPVEAVKFDPFGNRLLLDDGIPDVRISTTLTPATPSGVSEGFTGHEMEADLGVINMQGRIYDGRIARFLQADPLVAAPGLGQAWNRYSYVYNNPLGFRDPTGFSATEEAASSELTFEHFCQIHALACATDLSETFDRSSEIDELAGMGVDAPLFGSEFRTEDFRGVTPVAIGTNSVAQAGQGVGPAICGSPGGPRCGSLSELTAGQKSDLRAFGVALKSDANGKTLDQLRQTMRAQTEMSFAMMANGRSTRLESAVHPKGSTTNAHTYSVRGGERVAVVGHSHFQVLRTKQDNYPSAHDIHNADKSPVMNVVITPSGVYLYTPPTTAGDISTATVYNVTGIVGLKP